MNLASTTLLLTRPAPAARRFRDEAQQRLGQFGAVVISPLTEIVPLGEVPPIERDAVVIFTSEHGVAHAGAGISGGRRQAWCVGQRTAARARALGFDVVGVAPTADALAEVLLACRPGKPLVHIAGVHRQGDLAARLAAAGLMAATRVVYDQAARPLSADAQALLKRSGDVIAPSFSPRSTRLLATAAEGRVARVHLAAISANAAALWVARAGETVALAPTPDFDGMIGALGSLFDADRFA